MEWDVALQLTFSVHKLAIDQSQKQKTQGNISLSTEAGSQMRQNLFHRMEHTDPRTSM